MESKTINFITTHFYPEEYAAANRAVALVKVLMERYKVNVIFLFEKGKKPEIKKIYSLFNDNVKLFPICQKNFKNNKFFQRLFYETYYAIKLNLKNLFIKSDLTIITIPYLQLLPVSGFFSLLYKRKKVIEIRDLIWLYLDLSNRKIFKFVKKILEYLCKWSVNKFDYLVTVTRSQANYFNKEAIIIENGIQKEKFEELKCLRYPEVKDKIIITYAGLIGFPQNLKILVEVAKRFKKNEKFIFYLAGRGSDLQNILYYIEKNNLQNIYYLGNLSWRKVKDLYANSHILYAQLRDTESLKTSQPTKIFEYASTGFPIIFGGKGESEKFIKKLENSILIEPDNIKELEDAILKISNKLKKEIKNIQLIEKFYIRENLLKKYYTIIENI